MDAKELANRLADKLSKIKAETLGRVDSKALLDTMAHMNCMLRNVQTHHVM